MGSKCKATRRESTYQYRAIEVVLVKKDDQGFRDDRAAVLMVGNDWETLNFVKDNMGDIAANMTRVKTMKSETNVHVVERHVEESARLFEKKLQPLFTLISATAPEHVLDKLSVSLRKALLLMAMDRYSCDSESMCRALGLTKGKLESELRRCGLLQQESKAA